MVHQLQNYIGGEFLPPRTNAYMESYNPSTAKINAQVPDSGEEDVNIAVEAAVKAFPVWSSQTAEQRSRVMEKIADILESRLEEFAELESEDQGKPVSLARTVDIPRAISNFRFFATSILHHEDMSTVIDGVAINYTTSQPVGVAGLISPWNLPLYLLTWKIAPAIAWGNTCVCKPSEFTSVTAWKLCEVFEQAGLLKGVVNMVFGNGPNAGNYLCTHPKVPMISFTGGTKTGEIITKSTAPFCKKLSLELGGKNPNIIFADCDLNDCVTTSVRSSFSNQGEICLCGSRIFVEESIYDAFLEKFIEETRKLVVGDPRNPATNMGALVSEPHMEKVLYYINLAKEEGGNIAFGGDRPDFSGTEFEKGYFVNPTIITGLPPTTSRCQLEEIFGPVVTVYPFKNDAEAIQFANCVDYGLAASVWTKDVKRAQQISLKLHVGTVWVNCWLVRDLRLPFGGTKHSGVGREGGKFSKEFFTEQKSVCIKFS